MEEKQRSTERRFVDQFDTVIAFLCLEAIALTCFGIGGFMGIRIMEILGFFIAAMTIPFIRLNYSKADLKKNLKWLIPLGVFFVLMGFSAFFVKYYGGFGLDSIVYSLLEVLGLAGFFMLGFGLRHIPVVKKEYILYAFLGGLALYCVIVGLYSLIRYGFFYVGIYSGLSYYYKGVLYPIAEEGKALYGFAFQEVMLDYAVVPSLILGCSGVGLIGLSPKKEQRKFILLAAFACIGVLYSLFIPYWPSLVTMALVYVFALVYRLIKKLVNGDEKKGKRVSLVFIILYFALMALVALGTLLLLIENRTRLIMNLCNSVFGHVPNSIMTTFEAVNDCVYNGEADLHKVNIASLLFGYSPNGNVINAHPTRFFFVNVLWENGLIAYLLAFFVLFFFLRNGRNYLREGKEDLSYRLSIVSMALGIALFISFFSKEMPLVHGNDFLPVSQTHYMLALFFLLGLMYVPEKAKGEANA